MNARRFAVAVVAWLAGAVWFAAAGPADPAGDRARFLIVVSGLGGEPYYSERFRDWARTMVQAARQRHGIPAAHISMLSAEGTGPARSTKANLLQAVRALHDTSAPGDLILLLLIGHGTAHDGAARFNLPGPDLSPGELAGVLGPLADRRVAVVNAAPSSAPFVRALSRPGRIVITATAVAAENQHTVFAGHFAEAFATAAGDRDKDGQTSLLEAFVYARHATRLAFEEAGRLVTEHPLLDDDGDGAGSREPDDRDGRDGALAARFVLGKPATGTGDAERLALDAEARRLAQAVKSHARVKATMTRETYETRLETLLIALALNRRAAEAGR